MICVAKWLKIVILVTLFSYVHSANKPVLEILQLSKNVTSQVANSWKNIKSRDYSGFPAQIVNRDRSYTFTKKLVVDNLIKDVHFTTDVQILKELGFEDVFRWTDELNTIYLFYQDATAIKNADATTTSRKLEYVKNLRDKIRQLTTENNNRVQTLTNFLKV